MRVYVGPGPGRAAAVVLALAAIAACGSRAAADPDSRTVAWTYGPTTGGATSVHVQGTGVKDGAALARGWQCRLLAGRQLVVQPYQLAATHALFGRTVLTIGLFDQTGQRIGSVRSPVITSSSTVFTFELAAEVASRLWDLVIWYGEA